MGKDKIFFSYSRADASDFALKLSRDLRNAGANVWIDQVDIPPGQIWDLEIEKALESSKYVICIISERAVTSNNILNEVYYALDNNKDVIPVLISNCKIPFRLRRLQYIDFTKDYSEAFSRLQNIIVNEQSTATATEPSEPHFILPPEPRPSFHPQPSAPVDSKRIAQLRLIKITSIVFVASFIMMFISIAYLPYGYTGIFKILLYTSLIILIVSSIRYLIKYRKGEKTSVN